MFDAFYSDPHFGHKNIIRYSNRPFVTMHEMIEVLIDRYNSVVNKAHTCLWLGDAFFCDSDTAKYIVHRMNGNKIMIRGNHDKKAKWLVDVGIDAVIDSSFITMDIAYRTVRAGHYPYIYKNDKHNAKDIIKYPVKRKGEILIHGHTHSEDKRNGNQIHVGVDAWDFYPAPMKEIKEIIGLV